MRTTKSVITLIVGFCLFCSLEQALSQNPGDQLRTALEEKDNLIDIMQTVDSFYQTLPQEIVENGGGGVSKYKHWKRWEWEMSRRVTPNGDFVNSSKYIKRAHELNPRRRGSLRNPIPGAWESIGMTKSSYSADSLNTYNPGQLSISYANGTGRIDRIAFHPTDPNTIYVGTPYGGLWKTTDGGEKWTCKSDTIPSIGISGVVVHPTSPDIVYILTGTADNSANSFVTIFERTAPSLGVMKSIDGGDTWAFTDTFPTSPGVTSYISYDLVIDEASPNTLMAATSDGIFKTINGGTSWTKVRNGLHFDLQYKPGSSTTIYAATDTAVFYSNNAGTTWSASTFNIAPLSSTKRIALAVSPAASSQVYALCGQSVSSGSFSGLYRSSNSGVNFTQQSNTPNILGYIVGGTDNSDQGGYDLCMAVDPNNSNRLFTGGINVWTSVDFGVTMTNVTGWYETDSAIAYIHPDIHSLAFNPLDNKLYATTDGGVYVTSDLGNNWTDLSEGIAVSQFYHLTQYAGAAYRLSGGLQDNGIKYRSKGGTTDFTHMHGADGFQTSYVNNNPNVFYTTWNNSVTRMIYSSGAQTFITPPGTGGQFGPYFKEVLAHPSDTTIVFVGESNIHKSTNQGGTWSNNGAAGIWAMAISPSDPTRMYAAGGPGISPGNGAVYTSSNTGDTWTTISGNSGFPAQANYNKVTDIAIVAFQFRKIASPV